MKERMLSVNTLREKSSQVYERSSRNHKEGYVSHLLPEVGGWRLAVGGCQSFSDSCFQVLLS